MLGPEAGCGERKGGARQSRRPPPAMRRASGRSVGQAPRRRVAAVRATLKQNALMSGVALWPAHALPGKAGLDQVLRADLHGGRVRLHRRRHGDPALRGGRWRHPAPQGGRRNLPGLASVRPPTGKRRFLRPTPAPGRLRRRKRTWCTSIVARAHSDNALAAMMAGSDNVVRAVDLIFSFRSHAPRPRGHLARRSPAPRQPRGPVCRGSTSLGPAAARGARQPCPFGRRPPRARTAGKSGP